MEWQEMILSGSQAELQSLLIGGPGITQYGVSEDPSVISFKVLSNDIRLRDLPTSDPNIPGALWQHLPSPYAQSAIVMISSAAQSPGEIIRIPHNTANLDYNGDGVITTAEVTELLAAMDPVEFNVDSISAAMFDSNMDGHIGSADLLELLQNYGTSTSEWSDNRPVIDWCSIDGWIENEEITPASITAYFAEVAEAGGNIWEILPHGTEVSTPGYPVDNVYDYIAQTMTPSLETFLYIYFGQSTGGVWGGHDIYNRDSISCSA